jgi:hypothetical protein
MPRYDHTAKQPKLIGIQRELELLLPSGVKYTAFVALRVEGGISKSYPLYLAAETVEELKTKGLAVESVAEWFYAYRINDCFEVSEWI